MGINIDNFLTTLPIMGRCLAGIFIVIGLLIGITLLLNKLTEPKAKADEEQTEG